MRTFIAIELPTWLQRRLAQVQQHLDQELPPRTVRWTTPDRLHLTLRFLGETSPRQQEQMATGLTEIASRQQAFDLAVQGIGVFPHHRRLRIVWVGLSGALVAVEEVYGQIEQLAQRAGFKAEDRPFSPHITIGRATRNAASADLRRAGDALEAYVRSPEASRSLGQFTVTGVVHMHSDLRPDGPIYTPLDRFEFGGSDPG